MLLLEHGDKFYGLDQIVLIERGTAEKPFSSSRSVGGSQPERVKGTVPVETLKVTFAAGPAVNFEGEQVAQFWAVLGAGGVVIHRLGEAVAPKKLGRVKRSAVVDKKGAVRKKGK